MNDAEFQKRYDEERGMRKRCADVIRELQANNRWAVRDEVGVCLAWLAKESTCLQCGEPMGTSCLDCVRGLPDGSGS